MKMIDENSVVIYSAEELKTLLEGNNSYRYFYFGNNITLTTGITISKTKEMVVIDGTYEGIKYTYEDMKSSNSGDTLSVRNQFNKKVIIKNMKVIGHNYYGLVFVPENNSFQNTVIEYNNISYTGPQITFHPTGLSIYIDCDITIKTSISSANEVAECNRIEIGGITTIYHPTTSDSMFWFRGNTEPYFKILENASVTITSTARELFYGVNNLVFSVLKNATFQLTSALGMGYGTYATGSVLIDKEASVSIVQTKQNGNNSTWYCNGPFVMNEGSSLFITCNYSGINSYNYCLYFKSSKAAFTLNNPMRVVIYNAKAAAIYTEVSMPFTFFYTRINFWITATSFSTAGSISDLPSYAYYKTVLLSQVNGTITPNATTINSQNYTNDELSTLPALSNFKFQGRPVISIGTIVLNIMAITDQSLSLEGYTIAKADIMISYEKTSVIVSADENGFFKETLANTLPEETVITFLANYANSFIYQSKVVQIVYRGELTLTKAPTMINFSLHPISLNPVICSRSNALEIIVTDTRLVSSNWKLFASIDHDLTSKNGYTLKRALIYVAPDKTVSFLSNAAINIYTGEDNASFPKTTTVSWIESEGILLQLDKQALENNEVYTASIIWTLEE